MRASHIRKREMSISRADAEECQMESEIGPLISFQNPTRVGQTNTERFSSSPKDLTPLFSKSLRSF